MKLLAMISLALFSFVHNDTYVVENYSCENNQIRIQYDENWYDFSLFNVLIKEESDICAYVEGEVKVEFEPMVKIEEPLSGYLFVNGELLQKTLVEDEIADIKIKNPNYKYDLEVKKEQVLSDSVDNKKKTYSMQSRNIALIMIAVWIFILIYLIVRKSRRKVQKDTKSEENVV